MTIVQNMRTWFCRHTVRGACQSIDTVPVLFAEVEYSQATELILGACIPVIGAKFNSWLLSGGSDKC